MSDDAAQRLAALRAKRSQATTRSPFEVPNAATLPPDDPTPTPTPTPTQTPVRRSASIGTTRARLVVGSISGLGFVATIAAMGPVLVDTDGEVVEATGSTDPAGKAASIAASGLSADSPAPAVEVVPNYIYVDADGNPLSEAEVAALRTEPLPPAAQVEVSAQEAAIAALVPDASAVVETPPAATGPKATVAPVAATPAAVAPAAPAAVAPAATQPPATAAPAAAAPAATQPPATAAPAAAAPAATQPPATAAPAPTTAAPATTAAPPPATTAAPPPPTTTPPPPPPPPPPPATAPPKSGSSG